MIPVLIAVKIAGPAPACTTDAGSWCARFYQWTGNDLLARSADAMIGAALSILFILLLALVARLLVHRVINRLTRGAANGRVPRVLHPLRDRTPRKLRQAAAPLLSERRAQRAQTIGSVLRSIASVVIGVIASIMILGEFGVDLAPVLASAGIVGIALGFGAQNLVRDFLSGLFMLLEDQYGVGDVVDLGEAVGTVEAVGLRVTTLRDVHGTVWHVRNGEILRVGNKSQGYAIAVVDLPLAHNADTQDAAEIAGRVARETVATGELATDVLQPPEVLGVEKITPEGITLRVTVKVRPGRQWAVQRALNATITDAFDDAKLPRPAAFSAPVTTPDTAAERRPAQ